MPIRNWDIQDPIGQSMKVYRRVRNEIEAKVLALLEEHRAR